MGFRRIELGLLEAPVKLNGFEDSRRETGICVRSIMAGCLDPRSVNMSGTKLGSPSEDCREMAVNSVRRHIRLAQRYQCPVVIVRGCEVEDKALREESDRLHGRLVREGPTDEIKACVRDLVARVQKKGQRQVESGRRTGRDHRRCRNPPRCCRGGRSFPRRSASSWW
jgi:hypothetical protein